MDLTPDAVRALRATFRKDFQAAYDEAPVFYPQIATTVPSSGPENVYAWANQLPSLREWLGPRVVQNFATSHYSLRNKTWELTLGIKREDFEDDNLGVYSMQFRDGGRAAAKHPDELMITLLKDGESTLCWDGQNFFDTDHPIDQYDAGPGNFSNYSASGMALTQANYITVRSTMMAYKGESERNLNVVPNLLVVPPALEFTARQIVEAETIKSGDANPSNVTRGSAKVLVINELSGEDTAWYLLDTSRAIKPFVYQLRRPFYMTVKNLRDDEVVLEENEVRFYGDSRDNAGYSLPFLAYKAVA